MLPCYKNEYSDNAFATFKVKITAGVYGTAILK